MKKHINKTVGVLTSLVMFGCHSGGGSQPVSGSGAAQNSLISEKNLDKVNSEKSNAHAGYSSDVNASNKHPNNLTLSKTNSSQLANNTFNSLPGLKTNLSFCVSASVITEPMRVKVTHLATQCMIFPSGTVQHEFKVSKPGITCDDYIDNILTEKEGLCFFYQGYTAASFEINGETESSSSSYTGSTGIQWFSDPANWGPSSVTLQGFSSNLTICKEKGECNTLPRRVIMATIIGLFIN